VGSRVVVTWTTYLRKFWDNGKYNESGEIDSE
jgi:hypothetical protein